MATKTVDGVSELLQTLSVSQESVAFANTNVTANPLDVVRVTLVELLVSLVHCSTQDAFKATQWPNDINSGDLSVTLPRLRPGCDPKAFSAEVIDQFPTDHALFEPPLLDGVHLRVFLRFSAIPRLLIPYILDRKQDYGRLVEPSEATPAKPMKVVVEFSSPNIHNELQGKNLRSTLIGEFVARVYESMNWDVTRINYLGDWGKDIALLYVGWEKYGNDEAFAADPVGHLLEVHHKIQEEFRPEQTASKQARDEAAKHNRDEGEAQQEIESKGIFAARNDAARRLEDGDEALVAFWKRVREVNVEEYQQFYSRLGIHFDDYSGESGVQAETMIEVEQILKEKDISEESAGAHVIDMRKLGARAGHAIIRDRTGSTTYLLRDLAAVLERSRKYSFDKMLYVVASNNNLHFSQLFKIIEAFDKDLAAKLHHVKFSDASKMAATLGQGYKPQTILDKCEEAFKTLKEGDAEKAALLGESEQILKGLGISALLVQELSTRSNSAHSFDLTALPSFKAGTGPDLQYWYAKLRTLLDGHEATAQLSDEDIEALAEESPANVLRILGQYPETVLAAFHSLESSGIVAYLGAVTEQLSECLADEEGKIEVSPGTVALLEATRIVLENGMRLLGLVPIVDMPRERADTPVAG